MFGFKKKQKSCDFTSIIIVAAGNSTRMGENKLLMDICGVPVIEKTLNSFDNLKFIDEIILVCRQEDLLQFSKIANLINTPIKLVCGGETRMHSSQNGIKSCNKNSTLIGIHDGARPLVSPDLIANLINCAKENKTSIPVVAVKDTIREITSNKSSKTLDRSVLFSVQTPQFFDAETIKFAVNSAIESGQNFTDDASCVEAINVPIFSVNSNYDNIKITTKEDIDLANLIIERRGF